MGFTGNLTVFAVEKELQKSVKIRLSYCRELVVCVSEERLLCISC